MNLQLHKNARTTPAIRREIRESKKLFVNLSTAKHPYVK